MKAILPSPTTPRRGGEVKVGNVYANKHGRLYFRVVLAIVERERERPWNNVALLHIDATGAVQGCSMAPIRYVSEHMDLVGVTGELPDFTVTFTKPDEA